MKHLIVLLLFASLYTSCKKDDSLPKEPESDILSGQDTLLYGEWKYINSSGGYAGGVIDRGKSLLVIKPERDFIAVSKDNMILSGKIVLKCIEDEPTSVAFLQNNNKAIWLPQTIQFSGPDTLMLNDPCCDMYTDVYKRIK